MNKLHTTIYHIEGHQGTSWSQAVDDIYDNVMPYGLEDSNGKPLHFDNEIRSLGWWCDDHNLTLTTIEVSIDYSDVMENDGQVITAKFLGKEG